MMKAISLVALAALAVVSVRAGPCDVACTENYAPVCASNGRTYSNDCELGAAACRLGLTLTVTAQGECPVTDCSFDCIESYAAVCGSDGATYSNACELSRAQCTSFAPLVALHDGACAAADCETMCTEEYLPVCTKGGVTFNSLCELRAARCTAGAFAPAVLELAHIGRCQRTDCPRGCEKTLRPVCGSDGITYDNECVLRERTCRRAAANVVAVREGPCAVGAPEPYPACENSPCPASQTCVPTPKECFTTPCPQYECVPTEAGNQPPASVEECNVMCPMIYAPVCASDVVTYGNECQFQSAACVRAATTPNAAPLRVLHAGECTGNEVADTSDLPAPPMWTTLGFQVVMGLFAVLVVLSVVSVVYAVRKRRTATAARSYNLMVVMDEKDVSMTEIVAHGSTNLRDAK